jgi:Protein of unknown function (DUF2752)
VRLVVRPGAPPLGAVFGGIGLLAGAAIVFLHLDRLPFSVCVFHGLTGLPCPSCGSTRALGRLFHLDFAGALALNPFTTLVALLIAAWAVADVVLLRRKSALRLEVEPRLAFRLRLGALFLFLANWVYLLFTLR